MAGVPPEVAALAEFAPVEDILLPILRDALPGVSVQDRIWDDQTFPFVLVRRSPTMGEYQGDPRFTDWASIQIHAFCTDPDGDQDAAILSEACRVTLRDAATERAGVPGLGYIMRAELVSAPRRSADWATATGPVQYADLPTACWRYEARYDVEVRKSFTRPYPIPTP